MSLRIALLSLALTATSVAAQTAPISIIPRPVSLTPATGRFTLAANTVIWTDAASASVARDLARMLQPATGLDLPVRVGTSTTGNRIVFRRDRSLTTKLGAEGYRLDVRPGRVTVVAADPHGAFYAVQSIRQLLPPPIYREAKVDGVAWTMPAVSVEDRPRFVWRGAHLDVSRHFMPKEFVKKYIDLLAIHKMNTFHWHLTDDQGWRIEIKKYPLLTQVGAWRERTRVGREISRDTAPPYDNKRHGGFYTQNDIREIVAYAKARYVTIVPEIEMPGHSQAAIAAYPMLGNFDTLRVTPWDRWGVTPHILNPSDTTIRFMQDVLTEVIALFPGPYVHVGGDEAIKPEWKASPRAQAKIRELGIKPGNPNDPRDVRAENELQSWFITQMDHFLTSKGRRLVGWDEILEGGLAPNAVVMSWRGTEGGIAAARAGHDAVMTPGSHTYLDHYQSRDQTKEPLAIGGFTPIDSVYAYEPVPPTLEPEFAKHILGAQGQVWTEYIEGPKNVEYMAYPRIPALSETTWTPRNRKDFPDFMNRLVTHLERLNALDVNYRPLDAVRITP